MADTSSSSMISPPLDAVMPAFPAEELDARRASVAAAMEDRGFDGLVVAVPENIYYLTNLDHWGFFACHVLLIPLHGPMILVARAMESLTFENQVTNADFIGFSDDGNPADAIVDALNRLHLAHACVGLEKNSLFLTPRIAESVQEKTPDVAWRDASGLLDGIRLVQSPMRAPWRPSKQCVTAPPTMRSPPNATAP